MVVIAINAAKNITVAVRLILQELAVITALVAEVDHQWGQAIFIYLPKDMMAVAVFPPTATTITPSTNTKTSKLLVVMEEAVVDVPVALPKITE